MNGDKPADEGTPSGTLPVAESTAVETSASVSRYATLMQPFAATCGVELPKITEALTADWINGPDDAAIDVLADDGNAPIDDLVETLKTAGVKKGPARAAINALRATVSQAKAPAASPLGGPGAAASGVGLLGAVAGAASSVAPIQIVLPRVPDGPSFMKSLTVGGVLQMDDTAVISACKAHLAAQTQLDQVPRIMMTAMKKFARAHQRQTSTNPLFRKARTIVNRRSYAAILREVSGAEEVTTVPADDKNYLLEALGATAIPALKSFQEQVFAFVENYRQSGGSLERLLGAADPLLGSVAVDTQTLRVAVKTLVEALNNSFAGEGIIAARALAYDAGQTLELLDDPTLPASVGMVDKDSMLREYALAVPDEYEVLEKALCGFALAAMHFPDLTISGTREELMYIGQMNQLGVVVKPHWGVLTGAGGKSRRRPTPIGGTEEDDEI